MEESAHDSALTAHFKLFIFLQILTVAETSAGRRHLSPHSTPIAMPDSCGRSTASMGRFFSRPCPRIELVKFNANDCSGQMQMGYQARAVTHKRQAASCMYESSWSGLCTIGYRASARGFREAVVTSALRWSYRVPQEQRLAKRRPSRAAVSHHTLGLNDSILLPPRIAVPAAIYPPLPSV